MSNRTEGTILEDNWVVLLLSGGERKLQRVRSGARLHIGKHKALYDPLVGAPYGATFVLETGGTEGARLVRDARTLEELNASVTDAVAALGGASSTADNSELRDDGAASTAQTLDADDIARLKGEGASGQAVVLAIAAGSKTFAGKTAFSQEKYLRKKAKKHFVHVTVLAPTALALVRLPRRPHGRRRRGACGRARVTEGVCEGVHGRLCGRACEMRIFVSTPRPPRPQSRIHSHPLHTHAGYSAPAVFRSTPLAARRPRQPPPPPSAPPNLLAPPDLFGR